MITIPILSSLCKNVRNASLIQPFYTCPKTNLNAAFTRNRENTLHTGDLKFQQSGKEIVSWEICSEPNAFQQISNRKSKILKRNTEKLATPTASYFPLLRVLLRELPMKTMRKKNWSRIFSSMNVRKFSLSCNSVKKIKLCDTNSNLLFFGKQGK